MITTQGNGNIILKTHAVSSFIHLHLSIKGNVELIQSDEEKVEVECDENLEKHLEIVNSGSTLYVAAAGNYKSPQFTKLAVRVYIRQLKKLDISHEGSVTCPEKIMMGSPAEIKIRNTGNTELKLEAELLKILVQNKGHVILAGKCMKAYMKLQSEGNIYAKDFKVEDLAVKNMAQGNVELYANNQLSITHYGDGYVNYYGDAKLNDIKQYGEGAITHKN